MDKQLYIITNCGSIVDIFDNEQDMNEEMHRLCEAEKKYTVTHYYYGTETKTRGEYVCDKLCRWSDYWWDHAQKIAKRDGIDAIELLKERMQMACKKCPLKKYSQFVKEEQDAEPNGDAEAGTR